MTYVLIHMIQLMLFAASANCMALKFSSLFLLLSGSVTGSFALNHVKSVTLTETCQSFRRTSYKRYKVQHA